MATFTYKRWQNVIQKNKMSDIYVRRQYLIVMERKWFSFVSHDLDHVFVLLMRLYFDVEFNYELKKK